MKEKDLVIIGSGPAGYTAAIYAARANLSPLLFSGFLSGPEGGQLTTTTDVENYPGFPSGILGPEMMEAFKKQALRFGTEIRQEDVVSVDLQKKPFTLKTKQDEVRAKAIIIATGACAKRLDIPGTRDGEFWQKGVSSCAVCDGAAPIFRNKDVYVIGGGDSAVEEAIFLTRYAKKVYIVHRRDTLRASKIMAERALQHPQVEILWNSVLHEVKGEAIVGAVCIKDLVTESVQEQEAGGVFFAIGHLPNTKFLEGQLPLSPAGYIEVEKGTSKTCIPGVFAAGDVQDERYRQAVTAAGSGCMAALDAERYLSELGL
ncbi:MAG: thioredoxin-disulfide reductase [Chlamydiota bacterium]